MPDGLVERRRLEADRFILLAAHVGHDLPNAKKVRVAHQASADENGQPAKTEEGEENQAPSIVLNIPDHSGDRAPLPIKEIQAQAGEQDVRAALNLMRNKSCPGALKPRAGHETVLDGEEAQQERVHKQRGDREDSRA